MFGGEFDDIPSDDEGLDEVVNSGVTGLQVSHTASHIEVRFGSLSELRRRPRKDLARRPSTSLLRSGWRGFR